jgi:hypothetical protein
MPASDASRPLYPSQARTKRSFGRNGALGERVEVLASADDAIGFEALPHDVSVDARLAPDLLEDAVDVEELEGRAA